MKDIFISYKREDQEKARIIADLLEALGWSLWWDVSLRAGQNFDDEIEKAIRDAKCVVVLWSARSIRSDYVRAEATLALDLNKVIPVALDTSEPPLRFRQLHTISLCDWNGSALDPAFQALATSIAAIAGLPIATPRLETRANPVLPENPGPSVDIAQEQEPLDAILQAAKRGDLASVYRALQLPGPDYEESLEINDYDKIIVKNIDTCSRCLPPSEFGEMLQKIVAGEKARGAGARLLYLQMSMGETSIAHKMLALLATN